MEKELETKETANKIKAFIMNLISPKSEEPGEIKMADPSIGSEVIPEEKQAEEALAKVGDVLPDGEWLGKDGNVYILAEGKVTEIKPVEKPTEVAPEEMAEEKPETTKVTETKVTEVKAAETEPVETTKPAELSKEIKDFIELKLSEISKKVTSSGIKLDPEPKAETKEKKMTAGEIIDWQVEQARK